MRGWHVYPKAGTGQQLVVYFHEHCANLGYKLPFIEELVSSTNSEVIMIAYRGFEQSDGSPSERVLKEDCLLVMDAAVARSEGKPIFVFGKDIGGAVGL